MLSSLITKARGQKETESDVFVCKVERSVKLEMGMGIADPRAMV